MQNSPRHKNHINGPWEDLWEWIEAASKASDILGSFDSLFSTPAWQVAHLNIWYTNSAFGSSDSRIWMNNIKELPSLETHQREFLEKILYSPLTNKESIERRRDFFKNIFQSWQSTELCKTLNSLWYAEPYKAIMKLIIPPMDSELSPMESFCEENSFEEMQSHLSDTSENRDETWYYISYIKYYLSCYQDFLLILKQIGGKEHSFLHEVSILETSFTETNLNRDFDLILRDIKDDAVYREQFTDALLVLWKHIERIGPIIKLVEFIEKRNLSPATFDENKPIGYEDGFSVFTSNEDNIPADSMDDVFLTFFRAPNGSGKSFTEERDMFDSIFAQALWFTSSKNANKRIYSRFYSLNRMQSGSKQGEDLSALTREWKSLDQIFHEIQNSSGHVMLCLDETGSTTDEKNEAIILTRFIEAVRSLENRNKILLRLSTHNQPVIDHYKKQNTEASFYTFDDEHNLERGERDSDTLNTYRNIVQNFREVLKFMLENEETELGHRGWSGNIRGANNLVHDLLFQSTDYVEGPDYDNGVGINAENKKYYARKRLVAIIELERIIDESEQIITIIEAFFNTWKINSQALPNNLKKNSHAALEFSLDKKESMSSENKGMASSIYSSKKFPENQVIMLNNGGCSYAELVWKYKPTSMLDGGEGWFDDDDHPEWRQKIEDSYLLPGIFFTNSYRHSYFDFDQKLPRLFKQRGVGNIPLVQLRQSLISEIMSQPEQTFRIKESLANIGTFVEWVYDITNRLYYWTKEVEREGFSGEKYKLLVHDYSTRRELSESEQQTLQRFNEIPFSQSIVQDLRISFELFSHPLMSQIKNYYLEILQFVLWNVESPETLIDYLETYESKYWSQRILLGHNQGIQKGSDTVEVYSAEALNINFARGYYSSQEFDGLDHIIGEWRACIWILEHAELIKKLDYAKVEFTKKKQLIIKWMWNGQPGDMEYVRNDVELTPEHPIELINGFNYSGKTDYINNIVTTLNQALNFWYVDAEQMKLWWIDNFSYLDRVVVWDEKMSSWEQDILYWITLLDKVKDKDFVVVNVDEIFSTMDKKYSTAFSLAFVWKLREMWKFAVVISHNHDFITQFGELEGVKCSKFDSYIEGQDVVHTNKKIPGTIDDSAWVAVLQAQWIGKGWLY